MAIAVLAFAPPATADYNTDVSVNNRNFCQAQWDRFTKTGGYLMSFISDHNVEGSPDGYIDAITSYNWNKRAVTIGSWVDNHILRLRGAACGELVNEAIIKLDQIYQEVKRHSR